MTSESTLRAVHLEIEKPRIKPKPCSFRLDKVPAGKIEDLVQRHQGNLAAAARELGVARTTLRDKVKRMRTQDTELSVVAN